MRCGKCKLEVYRHPERIAALAEGCRGKFAEVPGRMETPQTSNGAAHPQLWATFTLWGPGR
jgi:hypothetical protein